MVLRTMITVDEFRARIRSNELEFFLDNVLLGDGAAHIATEHIQYLEISLAGKFGIPVGSVKAWIVGSAKLGFSLTEKRARDGSCSRAIAISRPPQTLM
jgi:hypothetical protein